MLSPYGIGVDPWYSVIAWLIDGGTVALEGPFVVSRAPTIYESEMMGIEPNRIRTTP